MTNNHGLPQRRRHIWRKWRWLFVNILHCGASCTKGGGEGSVHQIGTEFVVYTESTLSVWSESILNSCLPLPSRKWTRLQPVKARVFIHTNLIQLSHTNTVYCLFKNKLHNSQHRLIIILVILTRWHDDYIQR